MTPAWVEHALGQAWVARLATMSPEGEVRLVPICFAVMDGHIVSAVDHKPKRTGQLRRLDDITSSGTATLLVDHYDEDWTQLWWIRVRGRADVLPADGSASTDALAALVAKYEQYAGRAPRGPVYRVLLDELRWWRFTEPPD